MSILCRRGGEPDKYGRLSSYIFQEVCYTDIGQATRRVMARPHFKAKEPVNRMTLNEGLKSIFLAGVGAVAVTAEKSKEIIDELVKKGELTVEQGKVLNEELKRNIKEKVKETVTVQVVEEAPQGDILSQVDNMSREDRQALKEKLAAMEEADEAAQGDAADGE